MTDRFTNVKHAEFELLMTLMRKVDIMEWAEEGVPGMISSKEARDAVALKRARTAVRNVRGVLLNMAYVRRMGRSQGRNDTTGKRGMG